jgi:CheY-like chemotaxis protein
MADVVHLIRDLLFVSKLREAAEPLGLTVEGTRDAVACAAAARGAKLVVLDLRQSAALEALEAIAKDPETAGVRSIGFVDHEKLDVMETARALGCGRVVAKGQLAMELGKMLREVRSACASDSSA